MAHAHETQAKISLLKKTLFAGRNASPASFGGRRGGKCAVLALLFCVCGAMSAWGQATYYWNPDKTTLGYFNDKTCWKIFYGSSYSDANDIPKPGDSAVFGKSQNVPNSLELQDIDYNVRLRADAEITNLYVCFSNASQSVGSVSFSNFPSDNLTTKMVTDNFIIYNDNSNTKKTIYLNTQLTVGSNITIPSGITVTVSTRYNTTINGNLIIESGATLVVNGTLTVNGTITNNGTVTNNSTLTAASYTNNANGELNLEAGTFTVQGQNQWRNAGTVNVRTTGTISIIGVEYNENTANPEADGTWNYFVTRDLVVPYSSANYSDYTKIYRYYNLNIKSGTINVPANENISFYGVGEISQGATLQINQGAGFVIHNTPRRPNSNPATLTSNGTIIVNGANFISAGEFINSSTGVLHFTGTNSLIRNDFNTSHFTNDGVVEIAGSNEVFSDFKLIHSGNMITERGTWRYVNTSERALVLLQGNTQYPYKDLEIGNGTSTTPIKLDADVTATGKIVVSQNATLNVNNNVVTVTSEFTNAGTVNVGGGTLTSNAATTWRNTGTIDIGSGSLSNANAAAWNNTGTMRMSSGSFNVGTNSKRTDNGTWIIENTVDRSSIPYLNFNNLEIAGSAAVSTGQDLNVAETFTVKTGATYKFGSQSITTKKIDIAGGTLDAGSGNITANEISNNGTIRLQGTQNVSVPANSITNGTNSTVEFYGDTGNNAVSVSKMGNTFHHLSVKTNTGETKTITFPTGDTAVNGNMTLTGGGTGSRITVNGTISNIKLSPSNTGKGEWLNINYALVSINNGSTTNTYDVTTNCFDGTGATVTGIQKGWFFSAVTPTDVYYWFGPGNTAGGTGNWNVPGYWRYGSVAGNIANEAPGTKASAKVYITSGAVTLTNTLTNPLETLEVSGGAILTLNTTYLQLSDKITVGSGSTLDMAGTGVGADSVENKGTVRSYGTVPCSFYGGIINDTNSTVEFYGAGTAKIYNVQLLTRSFHHLKISSKLAELSDPLTVNGKLTVEAGAAFDLKEQNITAIGGIENNGTIKLYGTQTVTAGSVANGTDSIVEFYDNTNATQIDVSQMGTRFATLKCDTSAGNDRKVLDFSNVTSITTLNLNSNATNPLVIQGNAVTQITVAGTARGSGNNLRVDYKNVRLTIGTPYALTNSLGRDTATGRVEAKTTGIRNGWNFGGVAEYYFWTSGNDNWNEVGKWEQADDPDPAKSPRIPAERYPGQTPTPAGFGGYHVYIEPAAAATVTLNVSSLSISKITIGTNGTLELGANNLSVRGTDKNSWTNSGKVTVTSGNVMFTVPATDSGEWIYNNTADRSLINLTYNDLNLNGTGIITPNTNVSANRKITIGNNTEFDLASRDISTATIENKGTVRLHGTQTVTGANGTGTPAITNDPSSKVEFYGNTGNTAIDISKMGTSYGDLIVNGYNKTLAFPANTNVAGNLILKGANDNAPLTITTNATSATINVATSQQSNEGQYLRIDRAKVTIISGSPFGNPTCSYYAKNSYDTEETTDDALLPVRKGWKIDIPIHLTNMLLSVAPIGGNTVYVRAEQSTMDGLSSVPSGLIANMLKRFFRIYENTSQATSVSVTSANLIRNAGKVAWIQLTLSGLGNITIADLQKYYVRTYTNHPSATSPDGFHPISDFAVGAVNPLFAYDNRYADSDANWQSSAVSSGVAVRNWDADQGNTGSLLSKKDIVMSVRVASGVGTPVLHLSSNPTAGSQSGQYNSDTNSNWRVWLPDVTGVGELAGNANTNTIDTTTGSINVTGGGANPIFNIPASSNSSYSSWKDGDQITFMFGVTDTANVPINVGGATISGQTVQSHPLYALRLRNAGDINSLDLWSVRLRSMTAQRGGVSIRNNVINIATGEQVAIEVDMPKSGTLNVMIMTLDGSIVKYLQHGTTSAGKHVYHWGGLTNSSSPVARGLYFIRIVGSGIDETRKVMVVK